MAMRRVTDIAKVDRAGRAKVGRHNTPIGTHERKLCVICFLQVYVVFLQGVLFSQFAVTTQTAAIFQRATVMSAGIAEWFSKGREFIQGINQFRHNGSMS